VPAGLGLGDAPAFALLYLVASPASRLISILTKYVDQPIEEIRRFVESYAETAEKVPSLIEIGERIVVEHRIEFLIPDELKMAFSQEIDRLKQLQR
jgi:hypothetical protein